MRKLWTNVRDALFALPSRFQSPLNISSVLVTDLFTFNASLGATIEQQVVDALNVLHKTWDPDDQYTLYRFERQAQRFPDVVLKSAAPGIGDKPLMGIELKGWYALAKEREPSFRFTATPAVCTDFDLMVVFPWVLNNVVSGSPTLMEPYYVSAKYAALYRNYHWEYIREVKGGAERGVIMSASTNPYPTKNDLIDDRPRADAGGNFGRFARTGLMDEYMKLLFAERLLGLPLDAWQRFFGVFTEDDSTERVERVVRELDKQYGSQAPKGKKISGEEMVAKVAKALGISLTKDA